MLSLIKKYIAHGSIKYNQSDLFSDLMCVNQ